jgi:hypothetical protein
LIEEQESFLQSIFGLSEKIGKIPFSTIVKHSTGCNVIPIDLKDRHDMALINILENILKKFLKTSTRAHSRYEGKRVNEVGRRIEGLLVHEMNKAPLSIRQLTKTGYPDIEIEYDGQITYLEMKTSSIKKESGFRSFYYTSGSKIKANARHLLLYILVTGENSRYWKIEHWILSDLSKLSVHLKSEFNASKTDLMAKQGRILSS